MPRAVADPTDKNKDVEVWMFEGVGSILICKVVVPKESRGQGKGTKFMNDLAKYADSLGKTIYLTPDKIFGATSKARLVKFYKRFGFVENKGRQRVFEMSSSMYRKPKEAL